jgi:hypothetical protein
MAATSNKTISQPASETPVEEKKPVDHMPVITGDEHAGKGGSYVIDPATGARTLRERTKDAE